MSIIEHYSYRDGEFGDDEDQHHLVCEVCEESAPARLGVRAIEHHDACCVPSMLAAMDLLRNVRDDRLRLGAATVGDLNDAIEDLRADLVPVSAMGDCYPELVDPQAQPCEHEWCDAGDSGITVECARCRLVACATCLRDLGDALHCAAWRGAAERS